MECSTINNCITIYDVLYGLFTIFSAHNQPTSFSRLRQFKSGFTDLDLARYFYLANQASEIKSEPATQDSCFELGFWLTFILEGVKTIRSNSDDHRPLFERCQCPIC